MAVSVLIPQPTALAALGGPSEAPQPPFQVWDAAGTADRARWLAAWESCPEREVFAHPGYVSLYARGDRARALCACWCGQGVCILFPFLLRDLTVEPFWMRQVGPATDLITPYGYGGPVCWGDGDSAVGIEAFWQHFNAWAAEQAVVTEFVRFNLFCEPGRLYPGVIEERIPNIIRSLDLEAGQLWQDLRPKVRKNVHAARRRGVCIEIDEVGDRLDEFLVVYENTLRRHRASAKYWFPREHFEQLARALPGQFAYFHATQAGRTVSTELVLVSTQNLYSFLGGTLEEAFPLRPNDLLKYEIMRWGMERGKRRLVLGGGTRKAPGLYAYKRRFSPTGAVPFYVGRRVLRPDRYQALVHNRKTMAARVGMPWQPEPDFFPEYRAELPGEDLGGMP